MCIECILFLSLSFVSFIIKCFCYDSKNKNYNTLKHKFTINAFERRKLYPGHTGSKNKVTNHMIKLAKSSFDNMVSLVFTLRNHFLVKVFYFSRGKPLKLFKNHTSFEKFRVQSPQGYLFQPIYPQLQGPMDENTVHTI